MQNAPKSMRLQIAIMGRTNVGKSSFLNMIAGQDVAMTSPVPGTTTDVVEKSIELLPIGPVVFLDTAGIDDTSELAEKRIQRTMNILDRADIAAIITEPDSWSDFEDKLVEILKDKKIPFFCVINKTDIAPPDENLLEHISSVSNVKFMTASSLPADKALTDKYINEFKKLVKEITPDHILNDLPLVGDLVPPGGLVVLITPIDLEAPKGRLILPQVQAIRDILDNDAISVVVKEKEYVHALSLLSRKPDLVICDSQVVNKMVADTPLDIKCTTFSILFSRYKGDLVEEVRGVTAIDNLKPGDKVLIAEACSHHALQDDIGRVKIPRWLRQYVGTDIVIEHSAGRDYPANLSEYKVVVHCGGCMLTRREKLNRIEKAKTAGVPITNYGILISFVQGVLKRVLSPFPAALAALEAD